MAGASLTYALAHGYLVDQRDDTAIRQAYVNARLARNILRAEAPDVRAFLSSLGGGTASDRRVVGQGHAGHQRCRDAGGRLNLAVGVRLAAVEADYYELFSLAELEDTIELARPVPGHRRRRGCIRDDRRRLAQAFANIPRKRQPVRRWRRSGEGHGAQRAMGSCGDRARFRSERRTA